MTLDVYVEGCDASMSCMYSGFSKFRTEILRGWNEELGKLYEKRLNFMFKGDFDKDFFEILSKHQDNLKEGFAEYFKSYDEKIKKILDEFDKPYNEGMKIFAYHSDCDGEITPAQSELVLKAFMRVDPEKFDDSDEENNKWYRETYETWITMLTYSIENGKSIIFG